MLDDMSIVLDIKILSIFTIIEPLYCILMSAQLVHAFSKWQSKLNSRMKATKYNKIIWSMKAKTKLFS